MASQFDLIQKKILIRQDKIFRGSFVQLASMTVSNSPVDKGLFKSSWVFATGSPSNEVAESRKDSLGAIRAGVNDFKIGMSGFLTNAQPYALKLEFGHSDQAPNGMVRKYAAQWQQINNKVTRAIK